MLVYFEVVTMLQDADSGSASQKDLVQSLGRKVGSEGDVHPRGCTKEFALKVLRLHSPGIP